MQIKVQLNNLRIAPRKVREAADLIRNKNVAEARSILEFTVKRATESILKLLNSAVASALNDFKLKEGDLYVFKIAVDEGPKLKRSFPMSRGRAYPIIKRTSHVTLVLSEKESKKVEEMKNKKSKVKIDKDADFIEHPPKSRNTIKSKNLKSKIVHPVK